MPKRTDAGADAARDILAAIVDHTGDAIISKTTEGVVLTWNRGAERTYGYAAAETIGRKLADLIVPKERLAEYDRILEDARKGKETPSLPTERVRKDGARIMVSLSVSPILDAAGNVVGAAAIGRDVTREWWLEREKEAVISISKTFQKAPEIGDVYRQMPLLLANRFRFPVVTVELLDAKTGDMVLVGSHGIGAKERGMHEPTRMPADKSLCGSVALTGRPHVETSATSRLSYHVPAPVSVEARTCFCLPIRGRAGVLGVLTLAHVKKTNVDPALVDVLQVVANELGQQIEEWETIGRLRESDARFRFVSDHSADMVTLISPTGLIEYVSPAMAATFGYTEAEWKEKSGYDFIHPEDVGKMQEFHARLLSAPGEQRVEGYRVRKKNGDFVTLSTVATTFRDKRTGAVLEILSVTRMPAPQKGS